MLQGKSQSHTYENQCGGMHINTETSQQSLATFLTTGQEWASLQRSTFAIKYMVIYCSTFTLQLRLQPRLQHSGHLPQPDKQCSLDGLLPELDCVLQA